MSGVSRADWFSSGLGLRAANIALHAAHVALMLFILVGWWASAIVMAGAPVSMRVDLGQLNVIAVFSWLPLTARVPRRWQST